MTNKRDWTIELIRFIASCGIAIFHFEWIYLGQPVYFQHFYLWVEFFFTLSGFFLAKNALADKDESVFAPVKYTLKQGIKLWKPYIIAFMFSFVVYCLVNEIRGSSNILSLLFSSKWEIFFLQLAGFDPYVSSLNGVTGNIPALLASSLIVYFLIRHNYAFLVNVVIPLMPIFIYSHIIQTYGNLSQWLPYESWYTIGILRGLAGILIGAGAYIYGSKLCLLYKDKMRSYRFVRYIIGTVIVFAIFALVYFRANISFTDEVLYPYIFGLMLWLLYFREKKIAINKLAEYIFVFLGSVSYNIYLIHYGICFLFLKYFGERQYKDIAPVYLFIVLGGGISMNLLLKIDKLRPFKCGKISNIRRRE